MTRKAFSVSAFLRHGDQILMIRHKREGMWLPIGGEIESGEDPVEAVLREIKEEAGYEPGECLFPPDVRGFGIRISGELPGLVGFEVHDAGSKGAHMNFMFVVDVPHEQIRVCDEYSAFGWFRSIHELDQVPLHVRQVFNRAQFA